MFRVVEFLDECGRSPFRSWFKRLDPQTANRVATALYRLEQGNLSNVRSLGQGLAEYRIDAGPGYRIYFSRGDAATLVLLGGGTKRTQRRDIAASRDRWYRYRSAQQQ